MKFNIHSLELIYGFLKLKWQNDRQDKNNMPPDIWSWRHKKPVKCRKYEHSRCTYSDVVISVHQIFIKIHATHFLALAWKKSCPQTERWTDRMKPIYPVSKFPMIWVLIYSTDRTQPNTKADLGFALGQLWKYLRPLWVCSTRGPLYIRSWGSALCTHACNRPHSVVTAYNPLPLYIPNTLSSRFIM